jgi:CHAT domain-containing protein/Tfp pilus assembly protein PilF
MSRVKRSLQLLLLTTGLLIPIACSPGSEEPQSLREAIANLRKEGRYLQALEKAEILFAMIKEDPARKPFEVTDAGRLVETLRAVSTLSPSARLDFANADLLSERIDDKWFNAEYYNGAHLAEKQMKLLETSVGDRHPLYAKAMLQLARFLHKQGAMVEAESLFSETMEIQQEVAGETHPAYNDCRRDYARLLIDQDRFDEAHSILTDVLEVETRIYGENHIRVARDLNVFSAVLIYQGHYGKASPLLYRALAIARGLSESHPSDTAAILQDLAWALLKQGNLADAESYALEAVSIWEKTHGENHPDLADGLTLLGLAFHFQRRFDEAEPLYRRALSIRRRCFRSPHEKITSGLNNLAAALTDLERYGEAEDILRETIRMSRELHEENHSKLAIAIVNLANNLCAQEKYDDAVIACEEAIPRLQSAFGRHHPRLAHALQTLGSLKMEQGHLAAAESLLRRACHVFEEARLRAGTGMTRATFQRSPTFGLAFSLLKQDKRREAWMMTERGQGRALRELLMETRERRLSPLEKKREDSLKIRLAFLESRSDSLRKLTSAADEVKPALEMTERDLLEAESEWRKFRQLMTDKYPLSEGHGFSFERIQAALGEDTALVGWICAGGKEMWAYVIRRSRDVEWIRVASEQCLDAGTDISAAQALSKSVADAGASLLRAHWTRDLESRAHQLWSELMENLGSALGDVTELVLISQERLFGVPLEICIDDGGEFLCSRYAITYAPSASIYAWLRESSTHKQQRPSTALFVGDPPFNKEHLDDAQGPESNHRDSPTAPMLASGTLRSALDGDIDALSLLPRLSWSRAEVADLSALFSDPVVLVGTDATEDSLWSMSRSGDLGRFDVLHFATHALIDDQRSSNSALVLSQVDLTDSASAFPKSERFQDGLIRVREILPQWKLDADLVTLSACETGLGRRVWQEGYTGLSNAFLQVGARNLLVSLWNVEDKATYLIMNRFYRNYMGDPDSEADSGPVKMSEALRLAKEWLRGYIAPDGTRPYEHPFYWAGFILIGAGS